MSEARRGWRVRRSAAALAALVLLAGVGAPARAQDAPATADLAALLEPIRREHDLPALGGAIVDLSGAREVGVTGLRAAGSDVPVTPRDLWHLGSCTKAMTATVLARLVERGLLRWDSSLAEVFPDAAAGMDPAWRGVTVEQLLSHRSGAASGQDAALLILRSSEAPVEAQRREVLGFLTGAPPEQAPGSAFQYSNAGYVLAGAMAEAVSGRSWEELLEAELFAPLGIERAGFGAPGQARGIDQPRGHWRLGASWLAMRPGKALADNPAVLGPAGTVHASLAAWGRFAALHLRGARGEDGLLLAPASFRELHTPRGDGYALGWMVTERPWAGGRALTHSGSNTVWYAVVWLAPERGFGVLAVTNAGGEGAAAACDAAARALVQRALASGAATPREGR